MGNPGEGRASLRSLSPIDDLDLFRRWNSGCRGICAWNDANSNMSSGEKRRVARCVELHLMSGDSVSDHVIKAIGPVIHTLKVREAESSLGKTEPRKFRRTPIETICTIELRNAHFFSIAAAVVTAPNERAKDDQLTAG